ncbi:unnamed protein product [Rhodiola kirilowii]
MWKMLMIRARGRSAQLNSLRIFMTQQRPANASARNNRPPNERKITTMTVP